VSGTNFSANRQFQTKALFLCRLERFELMPFACGFDATPVSDSGIFGDDTEKDVREAAIADLFRDEPKRFRDPLQVMRFVLKLHREAPIAARLSAGESAEAAAHYGAPRAIENADLLRVQ
jgi:hypothetical protein